MRKVASSSGQCWWHNPIVAPSSPHQNHPPATHPIKHGVRPKIWGGPGHGLLEGSSVPPSFNVEASAIPLADWGIFAITASIYHS